jgi:hypothetical protein
MAVRLKLHGVEFEADSSAEALELYRQLSGQNGKLNEVALRPTRQGADEDEPLLGNYAKALLKALLAKPEGEKTEMIAEKIGVNGAHGLASPVRQIREWAKAKFGLDKEQCIRRQQRIEPSGETAVYSMIAEPLAQKIRGHERELLG